ncbi:MAG TPA: diaminobutyrate acetyltransferase [Gammaproteobacteria bacterium]|nr:diaminobutyrate acetyltransferase [Gammaproteobacteria bacterium]
MNRVLAINTDAGLVLRNPSRADGAAIWRLVSETGALEQNTAYTYLLLCTHFGDTCLVAEQHGRLDGCVLAYQPPREPDCLFVWQIGVAPGARGRGFASQLLDSLLYLPACRHVRFVTATVTPGNTASRALFAGFARRHGVALVEQPFLDAACFPATHPDEPLLKIGPLLA